jgi:hypothetical protein
LRHTRNRKRREAVIKTKYVLHYGSIRVETYGPEAFPTDGLASFAYSKGSWIAVHPAGQPHIYEGGVWKPIQPIKWETSHRDLIIGYGGRLDYYKPPIDLKPGAVNCVYPKLYQFTGSSIRQWYIERETEKTLFLKTVPNPNARSSGTYRLLKKDVEKEIGYRGEIFTYSRNTAIEKAKAYVEREQNDFRKLQADITNSINNLN